MKRAEKRAHLIDVAAELFNRYGYHAAGIDRVIAEAGIAKTTLYRHFKSKEDLIVAALRRMDERFRTEMQQFVAQATPDPKQRILATFDFLEKWFSEGSFYGCPFVSAAAEYGDRTNPVFQEAMVHKRLMLAYLEELARAADLADPAEVAQQICLIQEGATAVAQVTGDPDAAQRAKRMAARLIPQMGL